MAANPRYFLPLFIILILLLQFSAGVNADGAEEIAVEISAGNSQESVDWINLEGIVGEITTGLLAADLDNDGVEDILFVGSSFGFQGYFLNNGTKKLEYLTGEGGAITSVEVIDDINGDQIGDVLFTSTSQFFPNVIVISGADGDVIWNFRPSEESYFLGAIWTDVELKSWSSAQIDEKVIISAWKFVYALSSSNGDVEWRYEGKNDIWSVVAVEDINGDSIDDIIAGDQEGYLHAISGSNGNKIWKIKFTSDIETTEETFKANVWSIESLGDVDGDEFDELAISSEEGYVRLISSENGDFLWEKKIMPLSMLISESPDVDNWRFFNPRLIPAGDFDGDGSGDILSISQIRFQDWGTEGLTNITVLSSNPFLQGRIIQTISRDNQDDGHFDGLRLLSAERNLFGTAAPEIVMLTADNRIQVIDGQNLSFWYDVELSSFGSSRNPQAILVDDVTEDGLDDIILTGGMGYVACYNTTNLGNNLTIDPEWIIFPFGRSELKSTDDLNGDGLPDILLLAGRDSFGDGFDGDSWDGGGPPKILSLGDSSNVFQLISALDRSTGERIWTASPEILGFEGYSGFESTTIGHDLNGDGIRDTLTVLSSEFNFSMMLIALDSTDGKPIWISEAENAFKNWSSLGGFDRYWPTQALTHTDVTGDNIPDAMMAFTGSRLVIFNGVNGTIERVYDNDPGSSANTNYTKGNLSFTNWSLPFEIYLIWSNQTSNRITILGDNQVLIFNLSVSNILDPIPIAIWNAYQFDPAKSGLIENDNQAVSGRIIGLRNDWGSGYLWIGIDIVDLQVVGMIPIGSNEILGILPMIRDFNSDSLADSLIFRNEFDSFSSRPQLAAVDSSSGGDIWSIEIFDNAWDYSEETGFPAATIEDMNQDGISEIAAVGQYSDDDGMVLMIISGSDGTLLQKRYPIPRAERIEEWDYLSPAEAVICPGDLTGDGLSDILADSNGQTHFIDAFSLQRTKSVLSGTEKILDDVDTNGDSIADPVFASGEGFIFSASSKYDVTITSPADASELRSRKITVEWTALSSDLFTYITIDGMPASIATDEPKADILLPAGEHNISVILIDRFGNMASDEITVNASSSNFAPIINAIGIASIIAIISIQFIKKRLRRIKHEKEFAEMSENDKSEGPRRDLE